MTILPLMSLLVTLLHLDAGLLAQDVVSGRICHQLLMTTKGWHLPSIRATLCVLWLKGAGTVVEEQQTPTPPAAAAERLSGGGWLREVSSSGLQDEGVVVPGLSISW